MGPTATVKVLTCANIEYNIYAFNCTARDAFFIYCSYITVNNHPGIIIIKLAHAVIFLKRHSKNGGKRDQVEDPVITLIHLP